MGFAVTASDSGEAFLESDSEPSTECLILDVRMPGMSGLDLQRELAASARPEEMRKRGVS
jgi:FixJ family two-component response regulator